MTRDVGGREVATSRALKVHRDVGIWATDGVGCIVFAAGQGDDLGVARPGMNLSRQGRDARLLEDLLHVSGEDLLWVEQTDLHVLVGGPPEARDPGLFGLRPG